MASLLLEIGLQCRLLRACNAERRRNQSARASYRKYRYRAGASSTGATLVQVRQSAVPSRVLSGGALAGPGRARGSVTGEGATTAGIIQPPWRIIHPRLMEAEAPEIREKISSTEGWGCQ